MKPGDLARGPEPLRRSSWAANLMAKSMTSAVSLLLLWRR